MQGTRAGPNACLRLRRASSNSSAEEDPDHLSESSDDSGINIIRYFIAEPAEENRLIENTEVESRVL